VMAGIMKDEEIRTQISGFLVSVLKDVEVNKELYESLKKLITEIADDEETNKIIVTFISSTVLKAIDDNDEAIKKRIIALLTSQEVTDAVEKSIMDVVQRDDLKRTIGDNAVDALVIAIKKYFPKTLGLMV